MRCPIRYERKFDEEGDIVQTQAECLRAECAWWDNTLKTCAISRIANRLDQITYFLAKREEREEKRGKR